MSTAVQDILGSHERTHASLGEKKVSSSRTQPRGGDLFQALARTLSDVHQRLSAEQPSVRSRAEVEVRIGLISLPDRLARSTPTIPGSGAVEVDTETLRSLRMHFASGVSAPAFTMMKDEVGRQYRNNERMSVESVYVYDSGDLRDERVVVDGFSPPYRERKEPKTRMNFQLPAAEYDLRLQASIEHAPVPLVGADGRPTGVPADWSRKRTKRRASWKSPSGVSEQQAWLWRADITVVEETSRDPSGNHRIQVVNEVEFELLPQARDFWLSLTDEKKAVDMTSKIATHLAHLVEAINPMEPMSSITHPAKEQDREAEKAAKTLCVHLRPSRSGKSSNFPGAQPVNMCKRNVPDVQRGSYYMAEKTDGVRYLMIAVNGSSGPTCVLVDRSLNVFRVSGGPFLADVMGMGTILDGELVHNLSLKKAVFVAFDILQHGHDVVVAQSFIERLKVLKANVIDVYRARSGDAPDTHLTLIMKSFYKRRKIMDLFRYVRTEGRDRIFHEDTWRHHKTDGIIFQPDTPYTMGTDQKLLKWKWADLASVDLRVYPPGLGGGRGGGGSNNLRLCSEAGNGEEVDMSSIVHLSDHDRARLLGDIEGKRAIAEVALDPDSGLWVYMGLRPDKDRPNFINTVMSTMVEIAEGLSEDELKYRMLAETPASDDWARQEMTMRKRAVQWQYKKVSHRRLPPGEGGAMGSGTGNGMAHDRSRREDVNGKGYT